MTQQSALEAELRHQVERFLSGAAAYSEIAQWTSTHRWQPLVTRDRAANGLMAGVAVRLEEYARGFWSEQLLKDALRDLLDRTP